MNAAMQQLQARLVRFGGGGLAARIVALSLLLLLLVQAAGFGVVRSSIDRNARAQLGAELAVGERVWQRLLDQNAQRLRQGAMLLSADFGFRAAVTSGDRATIDSALDNHGARIGATVAALLDTGFAPRALHAAGADPAATGRLLNELAGPLAREAAGSRLVLIDGQPHQFVIVPLRAPVTIGYVMMGFPLGQAMADDMRALSGLHVALLAAAPGQPLRAVASTLPPAASATLVRDGLRPGAGLALDDDELFARTVVHDAGAGTLRSVLLRSVNEVVAPFRQVQLVLAAITLLGLALFGWGSAWSARRVTTPLHALVRAADRLGRGDYSRPLKHTDRADEIGDLAKAFDAHARQHRAPTRPRSARWPTPTA